METSIVIAKIIGPLLVVVGAGIFINLEHYRRLVSDFAASPLSIYMSGTIALVLGLLVVTFHNVWQWHWPVIITILGWLALIKGAVRILAPRFVVARAQQYARNTNTVMITAIVTLILGAALSYFGYAP